MRPVPPLTERYHSSAFAAYIIIATDVLIILGVDSLFLCANLGNYRQRRRRSGRR